MRQLLIWLSAACVFSSCGSSSAQPAESNAIPLTFIVADSSATVRGGKINVVFRNESEKPIIAYVLGFRYLGTNLKEVASGAHVTLRGISPGPASYEPRSNWTENLNVPVENGVMVKYELFIDYILFADGKIWGKDVFYQSHYIRGLRTGVASERFRLMQLLKRDGISSIELDLNRKPIG